MSEEVFQPTGGDGEAWLVIRAAALPPEDRLLWGHVHRHRVLAALGVGAGLLSPLDKARHRCEDEEGGHHRDGDHEDQQRGVQAPVTRAWGDVGLWKRENSLQSRI